MKLVKKAKLRESKVFQDEIGKRCSAAYGSVNLVYKEGTYRQQIAQTKL